MIRIIALFLVLLTACAEYENKFEKTLDSFVGKEYQDIVDYWGHPTDSYTDPSGKLVARYYRIKDITSTSPDRYDENGDVIEDYCEVFFEFDKDQVITSYTYRGTYCWEE